MGVMATHAEFDSSGVLYISYGDVTGPNNMIDGLVWKYQPKQEKFTDITPAAPKRTTASATALSVDRRAPRDRHVSTIDRWTHATRFYRTTTVAKT